jgi:hypothetical protein
MGIPERRAKVKTYFRPVISDSNRGQSPSIRVSNIHDGGRAPAIRGRTIND